MAKLKLPWSDYKSNNDSRSVWFPVGFTIFAIQDEDQNFKPTGKGWRVRWYKAHTGHGDRNERATFPGLTDKLFKTRYLAQLAAERFMEVVMDIAPRIVRTEIKKYIPLDDPTRY